MKMLYNSLAFNAMKSGLDGLAIEQKMILHNLANHETPGLKSKSVTFDKVLHKEKEKGGGVGGSYRFQATIHTNDAVELRPDGNNVDSDVESMKLYENYVRTQYLYTKISGQFANMNYVLDQTAK